MKYINLLILVIFIFLGVVGYNTIQLSNNAVLELKKENETLFQEINELKASASHNIVKEVESSIQKSETFLLNKLAEVEITNKTQDSRLSNHELEIEVFKNKQNEMKELPPLQEIKEVIEVQESTFPKFMNSSFKSIPCYERIDVLECRVSLRRDCNQTIIDVKEEHITENLHLKEDFLAEIKETMPTQSVVIKKNCSAYDIDTFCAGKFCKVK